MKRIKSMLFILPALLFAVLLCYSIFNALLIYIPQERERRSFAELRKEYQSSTSSTEESREADAPSSSSNPYSSLQQRNTDFVGWLTIEDTEIDYPVMKSSEEDPEYYLHRDFDGKDSSSGCLFIGGGCDANSDCFVIYGHKMNNDSMFGTLDSFADYEFAAEHNTFTITTPEEKRVYRVFAAFQTKIYKNRDDVFQYYQSVGNLEEEEYQYTVESIRALSMLHLPDAPDYPAQLLFLSTCSYHTEDGRFVVAAYRTE